MRQLDKMEDRFQKPFLLSKKVETFDLAVRKYQLRLSRSEKLIWIPLRVELARFSRFTGPKLTECNACIARLVCAVFYVPSTAVESMIKLMLSRCLECLERRILSMNTKASLALAKRGVYTAVVHLLALPWKT